MSETAAEVNFLMSSRADVRWLGMRDYEPVWRAMQAYTDQRDHTFQDELWVVEHPPVFTLGQAGKLEHVLAPGDIPLVQVDRGGQVTYHGPGQLVIYPLLDLRRKKMGVRQLVDAIEAATVAMLRDYCIEAYAKPDAPGVYVGAKKIMALGLRIRRGCSFHGLALNVVMDLEPFQRINPCGYLGLRHTQCYDEGGPGDVDIVASALLPHLQRQLRIEAFSSLQAPETRHELWS
jgi:lipoyl(octanoyl) transferase